MTAAKHLPLALSWDKHLHHDPCLPRLGASGLVRPLTNICRVSTKVFVLLVGNNRLTDLA
jgi:hypothetical protein